MRKIKYLAFFFLVYSIALAQEGERDDQKNKDFSYVLEDQNWKIKVPLWVPGFRGSIAYGDIILDGPDGDQSIFDRLTDSELGVEFYLITNISFKHNNWMFGVDGFSATLGSSLSFKNSENIIFKTTIKGLILRGVIGYKVLEWINKDKYLKWSMYPYTGLRYNNLHIYSENESFINIKPSWSEPIVGVYLPFHYKKWYLAGLADVGGFGINNHLSWFLSVDSAYRFSKLFALGAGWSVLDLGHEDVRNNKNLDLGIRLSGPTLSLNFSF